MSRPVSILLVVAVLLTPRLAKAQLTGCETYITITSSPSTMYYSATANVTVEYGDLWTGEYGCLSYGGPDPNSFTFYVNGVDRTSYFTIGQNEAVATDLPVDDGVNVLHVDISGNDVDGNPRTDSDEESFSADLTPAPQVSLTPYNFDHQDRSRCAVSCFAAVYAQSTVPYFTYDTPRNVTLVYNGERLNPHVFVHVDVTQTSAPYTPARFWLQVKKADNSLITFLNGETKLQFTGGVGTFRLGGQIDAASNGYTSTGVYPITIVVSSEYTTPSLVEETSVASHLTVVNEASSPFAKGWRVAGLQQLYPQADGSALIAEGDGSAILFKKPCGGCQPAAPVGEFTTLTDNGSWSEKYVRTYPDSTRVTFRGEGYMTQVVDRFGNTVTFQYDGSWRPLRIYDPYSPLYIEFAYGSYGLSSIRDAHSRYTDVTVQSNGTLTAIEDPDNVSTTFGYDGSLRLQTITDRGGNTTRLTYDQYAPGLLAYVDQDTVWIHGVGNAAPRTTFTAWQKGGVPWGATSSTPFTAPWPADVKAWVTDPESNVSSFTATRWGQELLTWVPTSQQITRSYNGNGQLISINNPLGMSSGYGFDASGFMTSMQLGGVYTYFRKAGWAQPDSVWGDGETERRFIGANGRVDSVRVGATASFAGYVTRYRYESRGRVDSVVDPEGYLKARTWYAGTNGNRSKDSIPGGRVTTYGYNSYGLQNSVNQAGLPTRSVTYDILNRPTHLYDGVNGQPTVQGYDNLFLTSVTDPKGQVYEFAYNALGWVHRETDPTDDYQDFAFDRNGRVRRWSTRRGNDVDFAYDNLGRRTIKNGSDLPADTLSYPAAYVLVGKSGATIDTIWHNTRWQPDSIKTYLRNGGQTITRRFRYTYPGYRLDSLWATGGPGNFQNRRFAYTANRGTLDSMRVGSSWTKFDFNDRRQVSIIRLPGSNYTINQENWTSIGAQSKIESVGANAKYHYDIVGRMDGNWTADERKRAYAYDSLSRLKETKFWWGIEHCGAWEHSDGYYCYPGFPFGSDSTRTYAYDEVGNRTSQGGTYTTGNRITDFDGCDYTTDDDGNVTSRSCGSVGYKWTADSRLDTLTVGANTIRFLYDAFGRLVRKDVNGTPTSHFIWNGDNLFAELNGNGSSKIAEYSYYGIDDLHALITSDNYPHYAHTDGLGNVVALSDMNKNVNRTYQYDDWGKSAGGSDSRPFNNADRARFKGALWFGEDGVELYYMRNRWYEPPTGRFLSEDPIGLGGGINLYSYVGNNPISFRDPSGDSLEVIGDKEFKAYVDSICTKTDAKSWCDELKNSRKWFYIMSAKEFCNDPDGASAPGQIPGCSSFNGQAWQPGTSAPTAVPNDVRAFLEKNYPGRPMHGIAFVGNYDPDNPGSYGRLFPNNGIQSWGDVIWHEVAHLTGIERRGLIYTHGPDCGQFRGVPGPCRSGR